MDVLLKRGMKEGFLVLFFIIVISNLFYLINGGGIGGVISYSLLMPFGIILSFLMPEICFFFGIGFGLGLGRGFVFGFRCGFWCVFRLRFGYGLGFGFGSGFNARTSGLLHLSIDES